MSSIPILQHEYLAPSRLAVQPSAWWASVLGVVGFDRPPTVVMSHLPSLVPLTASMTPTLGASTDVCEVWRVMSPGAVAEPLASATHGAFHFRHGNEFLFGSMTLDERAAGADGDAARLMQATELAYTELFALLESTGHRHLVRIWNYLPNINGQADGDERYRHFNTARKIAFRKSGRATVGSVPAACALGSKSDRQISVYFLASRRAPLAIENPRQTSAYHYPPKFGAHAPIFSRAGVLPDGGGTDLFISGTASIVGHETLHQGDVRAQTRESLANIDALVKEANRLLGVQRYSLDQLKFKVYVRRRVDFEVIEAELSNALAASASVVYVQADVCREELLVEIEATGESLGELGAAAPAMRRAL